MNKKKPLLIFLSTIVILFIVLFFFISEKSKNNTIIITNLEKNIPNISLSNKTTLQKELFPYILEQNNINNIKTKNYYYGTIRDNSIQSVSNNIDNKEVYSTSFILDIASLKYSYNIKFSWSNDDILNTSIDLGSTYVSCLLEENLIYEDFNCKQNPLIETEVDPVLETNLILNEYCWMSPFQADSNNGYGINIYYHPTTEDYLNNQVNQSFEKCISDIKTSLQQQNINLNNYKINTQIKYFYNY